MPRQAETIPDRDEFARSTEPFRRELLAHCYRMLGSLDEAEDLVQETFLRAWRSYAGFEGRSSLRVWLYRIATNACLTALEQQGRRALPSGLGAPGDDPDGAPTVAGPAEMGGVSWLGPIPDALVTGPAEDPATIAVARESLRLGLIACLQYLPSLQRARARLEQVAPSPEDVSEPAGPEARALLEAYITAFQNADPAALERVLRKDAALEPVGTLTWFSGRDTCMRYVSRFFGAPGDWQMAATAANGQPAAATYLRGADGVHRAFGLAVLTVTATGIARIVVFGDPGLVTRFGLPPER